MKKIVVALAMLLSVSGAMAQNNEGDNKGRGGAFPRNEEEMTTMMVNKLSLSEAQQTKVKKLNKKYAELFQHPGNGGGKGPGMNSNGQSSENGQRPEPPQMSDSQRQQMESEMKARKQKQEAYEKELKTILSSDQYTSYQKLMPQRRGPRPNNNENNQ